MQISPDNGKREKETPSTLNSSLTINKHGASTQVLSSYKSKTHMLLPPFPPQEGKQKKKMENELAGSLREFNLVNSPTYLLHS